MAYVFCLLPNALALIGMKRCLSVDVPFLVAGEFQAKRQALFISSIAFEHSS